MKMENYIHTFNQFFSNILAVEFLFFPTKSYIEIKYLKQLKAELPWTRVYSRRQGPPIKASSPDL